MSRAATAFCLTLACCACERVPAALFYRACQTRRRWHATGDRVDSCDHLEDLPSWFVGLFRLQEPEISAKYVEGLNLADSTPSELLGIRPDDVQTFAASVLLLQNDLQYISDLHGFATVALDGTIFFVLTETWKRTILHTASERLRTRIWKLLATVAAYAMPIPYTEPLWTVFQAQLQVVIESTVVPFLSVLESKDVQDWNDQLME